MPPRYQCYSREGSVWWRLLGSNNRAVARSAVGFPDLAAALADVERFPERIRVGEVELVNEQGRQWQWVLRVDDEAVAVSPVSYGRRLECVRAVARLEAVAGSATVAQAPLVRRHRLQERPGTPEVLRTDRS